MIELIKFLKCLGKVFLGMLGLVAVLAFTVIPFFVVGDNFGLGWALLSLFITITISLAVFIYIIERET